MLFQDSETHIEGIQPHFNTLKACHFNSSYLPLPIAIPTSSLLNEETPIVCLPALELPSAQFQAFDPSSFISGPFQNIIQQLFNKHQHI